MVKTWNIYCHLETRKVMTCFLINTIYQLRLLKIWKLKDVKPKGDAIEAEKLKKLEKQKELEEKQKAD